VVRGPRSRRIGLMKPLPSDLECNRSGYVNEGARLARRDWQKYGEHDGVVNGIQNSLGNQYEDMARRALLGKATRREHKRPFTSWTRKNGRMAKGSLYQTRALDTQRDLLKSGPICLEVAVDWGGEVVDGPVGLEAGVSVWRVKAALKEGQGR
jgi:hypothetical protein